MNGFPGPYTKYVLSTIGVDGILKLMKEPHTYRHSNDTFFTNHADNVKGEKDRGCGFIATVAYVDEEGHMNVFEEPRAYFGELRTSRIIIRPQFNYASVHYTYQ